MHLRMKRLLNRIKKAIANPKHTIGCLSKIKYNPKLLLVTIFGKKYPWAVDKIAGIKKKTYRSYSDYLEHQKSKLSKIQGKGLVEYDNKYRSELRIRLKELKLVQSGMTVLCLAARVGTEVKAFLDLNCFAAVGLDLNPGKENKYVVYGDFHNIQFPTSSADIIFTNSLDHVFDLSKLIIEVKRVLKPNGYLFLEIVKGEEEGYMSGYYEAFHWKRINELISIFCDSGFSVFKKTDFDYPWFGQQVVLVQ